MVRFDPRLRAVRRGSDRALLQAARRTNSRDSRVSRAPATRRILRSGSTTSTAWRSCPTAIRCPAIARTSRRRWTRWTRGTSRRWASRSCVAAASGRRTTRTRRASPSSTRISPSTTGRTKTPLGKRFRLDGAAGTPVEIVGVAQTIKYRDGLRAARSISSTCRSRSIPSRAWSFSCGPTGDPRPAGRAREGGRPGDRSEHAACSRRGPTRTSTATRSVEGPGMAVKLVGTLGAVGLVLAIAGLYGLVAYNVTPPDARDRHPHGDRGEAASTCCGS